MAVKPRVVVGKQMLKSGLIAAISAALSMSSLPIERRNINPSGSPKRIQERARRAMAQRSRTINRMREK